MRINAVACLAGIVAVAGFAVVARVAAPKDEEMAAVKIVLPADMKWSDAAGLPAGTKVTVLSGDPAKAGPFAIRLQLPSGWKVLPHTHPADEAVTVISGTVAIGTGETFDDKALKEVPAGGFFSIPSGHKHFATAKDASVIQINAVGPWDIHYVNPTDDPRGAAK